MKIELFYACGKYNRAVAVYKQTSRCFECEVQKECLVFDSSDREYSEIVFCIDCLNKFSKGHISAKTYDSCDVEENKD